MLFWGNCDRVAQCDGGTEYMDGATAPYKQMSVSQWDQRLTSLMTSRVDHVALSHLAPHFQSVSASLNSQFCAT